MNKKDKAVIGILGAVFFCAQLTHASETTSIGNLTETSGKISSIDMNKNLGEAGKVLDGFYNGVKAKKDLSSSAVYLEPGNRTLAQAEKEICNAQPSKIVLSAKVPPLKSGNEAPSPKEDEVPLGTGILAAGVVAVGLAGRKKGYFRNYLEDLETVWDYVTGNDDSTDSTPTTPGAPNGTHPQNHPNDNACNTVNHDGSTNCN